MDDRLALSPEELSVNRDGGADAVLVLVYADGTRRVWGKRSRVRAERQAVLALTMREVAGVALWDPATGDRLFPWED